MNMQITQRINTKFKCLLCRSNINNNKNQKAINAGTTSFCCCCCKKMKILNSSKCCVCSFTWRCRLIVIILVVTSVAPTAQAAPPSAEPTTAASNTNFRVWPPLKHYDIWNTEAADNSQTADGNHSDNDVDNDDDGAMLSRDDFEFISNKFNVADVEKNADDLWHNNTVRETSRQSKVIHLFPVPVDGECLSDDGRRTGSCFNAYECRKKGGEAKGECAMGFGVCCIFIANCNDSISNNITYLVSPNFPSFMPNNFSSTCRIKVQMMNTDVSQLRIDFYHFSLGQPNRRTGRCDGDVFNVSGGPSGTFSLCGQNSGQHIYYDVGGRALPRQQLYGSLRPITYDQLYPNRNATANDISEQIIDITMNFTKRFLPIRLWEIRIAQIPFSQRAPAGCLQYHIGLEGIIQTFNFAENGRHLANQHYRICMRQETEMCSIMYQPCDEQSFRIGPSGPIRMPANVEMMGAAVAGSEGGAIAMAGGGAQNGGQLEQMAIVPTEDQAASTAGGEMGSTTTSSAAVAAADSNSNQPMDTTTTTAIIRNTTEAAMTTTTTTAPMIAATDATTMMSAAATSSEMNSPAPASASISAESTTQATSASNTATTSTTLATSPLSDDVEGSGDDNSVTPSSISNVSRRPRPVSGGFDILGFLRSAFDFNRRHRRRNARQFTNTNNEKEENRLQRQFFSACTDRITMPCIIEDFIGTGLGPLPGCEPVHCGAQFCSSGVWPCRIESTVTPFYIGVHFGDGAGKGSAEDNIGACIRYAQVQCM